MSKGAKTSATFGAGTEFQEGGVVRFGTLSIGLAFIVAGLHADAGGSRTGAQPPAAAVPCRLPPASLRAVDLIYFAPPIHSHAGYNVLFAEHDGTRTAAPSQ
jgi:hypothetical protein